MLEENLRFIRLRTQAWMSAGRKLAVDVIQTCISRQGFQ